MTEHSACILQVKGKSLLVGCMSFANAAIVMETSDTSSMRTTNLNSCQSINLEILSVVLPSFPDVASTCVSPHHILHHANCSAGS